MGTRSEVYHQMFKTCENSPVQEIVSFAMPYVQAQNEPRAAKRWTEKALEHICFLTPGVASSHQDVQNSACGFLEIL